ncbi:extracellular solute-binding protein family 5 [Salinarchaeum sp. Harcht-Bsk1]|uniref:ABC transporter substrate-binding protein n=1 Tax=Salinarchaeum sp. Harcht-Bsk1 TaxID=1333523 RepID=UPI0003423725|nr:extracellular solute-binding protein family 5 [Salinarchaeum sp. Harcht-Bsk1]
MADDNWFDRRTFLKHGSVAGASIAGISLAGCTSDGDGDDDGDGDGGDDSGTDSGGGDTDGDDTDGGGGDDVPEGIMQDDYWQDLEEPSSREGYLQRANLAAHQEAPWIFLNRQYSNYGKVTSLEWTARSDELIWAYPMSPDGNSVTVTQGQMDTGLDPHAHRETPTDNIVTQAYDRLLMRTPDDEIEGALASDWERIEEGHVRFQIREGVTFHNGDELTPDDVAFSINRVVDPEVSLESPQNDQLAGVTGAEVVDGERAVDVFSDGINPVIFSLFASYCNIVQRDWIESRDTSEINSDMNGTGAFQLSSYESGESVVYEAFDDHWRGAPEFDTLEFRAASEDSTRVNQLLQGETDIVVNVPPQEVSRVQDESSTEMAPVPSTRIIYNGMKYNAEPFDDPLFRRAMNYAIDLESIVQNVLQTFADQTAQPTLEGFVGYNPDLDPYPYDPEMAEQLVEASGYAGVELELHTPVGRYLKDLEIAQATAGYVDELSNVSASVNQREFASLAGELTDGDLSTSPDWYLIGWGNAVFDASQTIIPLLTSDGALTSWQNEDFDTLVDEAQSLPGSQ